jgi:hypothetical protein
LCAVVGAGGLFGVGVFGATDAAPPRAGPSIVEVATAATVAATIAERVKFGD